MNVAATGGDTAARLLRVRWIVRAPVWLYRARLGFVFGSRLLMLDHLRPFPDAVPALRALAALGYELAVLSNGTPMMIGNCLANSGLGEFFNQRISVDEVRVFKPSPAVYQYAAERLSRSVRQIWLVTSNAFDCVGASAAGMRTAWVNRSAAPFDTIGQPPGLTVPALDRLPAALAG